VLFKIEQTLDCTNWHPVIMKKGELKLHCPEPECLTLGPQSCSFDVMELLGKPHDDETVMVIGERCKHRWSLPAAVKEKLRKSLQLY
jgi:hypothetical protein